MASVLDITLPDDGSPHLLATAGVAGANVRVTGAPYLGGSDMSSSGSTTSHAYPATADTPLTLGGSEKLYGMNLTVSGGDAHVHVLVTNGLAV